MANTPRFADDLIIMTELIEDFGTILSDLNNVSQQVDVGKTNIKSNVHIALMLATISKS